VAEKPEYWAQYLICKVDDRPAFLQERMATFAALSQSGMLVDFRPNDQPVLQNSSDRIVQFYAQTMPISVAVHPS